MIGKKLEKIEEWWNVQNYGTYIGLTEHYVTIIWYVSKELIMTWDNACVMISEKAR